MSIAGGLSEVCPCASVKTLPRARPRARPRGGASVAEREPDPGFSVVDRRRRGGDDEPAPSRPAATPVLEPARPAAPPPQPTVGGPGPAAGGPPGAPKADLTSLLVMLYGD